MAMATEKPVLADNKKSIVLLFFYEQAGYF